MRVIDSPSPPPVSVSAGARGAEASTAAPTALAPVVFALPNGLDLGGVTTWAVNLANGLAQRGRHVTLLCHPIPDGHAPASFRLDPRVRRVQLGREFDLHHAAGDLSTFIPLYRDLVECVVFTQGRRGVPGTASTPAILFPNILGDCYALGAALCATHPELVRVIAWQHTDSDYDAALIARHEPILSRVVAIDDAHASTWARRFPNRSADITTIPHGVRIPETPPSSDTRGALRVASAVSLSGTGSALSDAHALARPVRLLYTGRIEHRQKRILSLVEMARELQRRRVPFELTIIGDGPARSDLHAAAQGVNGVRLLASMSSDALIEHYKRADAFVLPSRYEGLCLSRIEAAAHGCVPIVTTDNSGAGRGLQDGVSALFVSTPSSADEAQAGRNLADAVRRLISSDVPEMSVNAWASARAHYSMDAHIERVSRLIDDAATSPPRFWPSSRSIAFSAALWTDDATGAPLQADATAGSGALAPGQLASSGSLGPDAARRLFSLLHALKVEGSRGVVLHGAGQHTIGLASVLARSPVEIMGVTDDDTARHGQRLLGWTIQPPTRAGDSGASDVVISSYIHMDSIWSRRSVYESQNLRVHRLY